VCFNNEGVVFDDFSFSNFDYKTHRDEKCGAFRSQLGGMCEMNFVVITGRRRMIQQDG